MSDLVCVCVYVRSCANHRRFLVRCVCRRHERQQHQLPPSDDLVLSSRTKSLIGLSTKKSLTNVSPFSPFRSCPSSSWWTRFLNILSPKLVEGWNFITEFTTQLRSFHSFDSILFPLHLPWVFFISGRLGEDWIFPLFFFFLFQRYNQTTQRVLSKCQCSELK